MVFVLIQEDLKVSPYFVDAIAKATLSPVLFKDPECCMTTSFPGSLFSASIVVVLNDNGGREERPWEQGCVA